MKIPFLLIIGYGAIAKEVMASLSGDAIIENATVLVRAGRRDSTLIELGPHNKVIESLDELSSRPDYALECAGHTAVMKYGPHLLGLGCDLGIVSIGCLADPAILKNLTEAAKKGQSSLEILAGAIGGLDALAAAQNGGLESVVYKSRKPPASWLGTPAEQVIDLANVTQATTFYEGTARQAALSYPKNANVAATVALAGCGFDFTRVTMTADPAISKNIHRIEAKGAFGEMAIELSGVPLPDNPSTSSLTAFSCVRAIKNALGQIRI